jgi:hypothetical protein
MALVRFSGEVSIQSQSVLLSLCSIVVLKVFKDSLMPFRATSRPAVDVHYFLLAEEVNWVALSADRLRFEADDADVVEANV